MSQGRFDIGKRLYERRRRQAERTHLLEELHMRGRR